MRTDAPMRGTGRTALVVEGDSGTREMCRSALESAGFAVTVVDCGVNAVSAARLTNPDIVLFDLELRDVRGSDLLDWLRSNPILRHSPMIAISALADGDAAAIADRVDSVLRKPISQPLLIAAVNAAFQAKTHRPGWEDIE